MRHCHVCKVECENPRQCSQCKQTIYCRLFRAECQKQDWKVHKRSTCTKPALLHKVDKMLKKHSGPNTPLGTMTKWEEIAWAQRRANPQPARECDGCFRRFKGFPPTQDDIQTEEMERMMSEISREKGELEEGEDVSDGPLEERHAGDPFKHCSDCDWTICEDCTQFESQGIPYHDRPPGTCRCPKSNFGIPYCTMSPLYLHGDGRKLYHGDRHPKMAGSGYSENAYESNKRACKNCGIVAWCLKKEHLKDAAPGLV
ncbi:hypothetical protein CPB83DRAFT_862339 [Crepidotus variabilis]|uniref:MYND-type domain-containing protein n=1 Tax=Crepidotus variabilis TaxID=179855 RepID=A0A9P6JKE5_9AGAR|nr:hypothetical protein CPB83DRAFT_862339 [Crepidotus variabilis]